jgi:hypothetical protein
MQLLTQALILWYLVCTDSVAFEEHLLESAEMPRNLNLWFDSVFLQSHDSSVSIALDYGLDNWILGFDSQWGLGIFLFTTTSRTALGPTQPPIQWVPGALSLGVKRLGHEADHSPPSSAKVKNVWSYTSTPQYFFMAWCLVKHRDNFTFTFTFYLLLSIFFTSLPSVLWQNTVIKMDLCTVLWDTLLKSLCYQVTSSSKYYTNWHKYTLVWDLRFSCQSRFRSQSSALWDHAVT